MEGATIRIQGDKSTQGNPRIGFFGEMHMSGMAPKVDFRYSKDTGKATVIIRGDLQVHRR
jgi:hypothetical protein